MKLKIRYNISGESIGSEFQATNKVLKMIESGILDDFSVTPEVCLERVLRDLQKTYREISAKTGCLQGCYGSNTGIYDHGYTFDIPAELLPERWIDEDGDEIVNIKILLLDHATELDLDADDFHESMEALEVMPQRDNTYNYLGHSSEDPIPLQHVDFCIYNPDSETYGAQIVVAKFHFGGDIRGNYLEEKVYKFRDPEDFYTVFYPRCILKEEI